VLRWLDATRDDEMFVSVLTLAELRYGIDRMSQGRRRMQMEEWFERGVSDRFAGRLVLVDAAVADAWGRLRAARETSGRPLPVVDGLLAATARVHGLTLVTRNLRDFADTGVALLDPWSPVS
jgi:hypothetical protein